MKVALTPSEEEIMNLLWETKQWMTIKEMIGYFEKVGKYWKRQTINTFLAHLIEKGLVVKNGRKYMYAYSIDEYKTLNASVVLDSYYGGSLQNFVAALSGTQKLDYEEAEKLRTYLDNIRLDT